MRCILRRSLLVMCQSSFLHPNRHRSRLLMKCNAIYLHVSIGWVRVRVCVHVWSLPLCMPACCLLFVLQRKLNPLERATNQVDG